MCNELVSLIKICEDRISKKSYDLHFHHIPISLNHLIISKLQCLLVRFFKVDARAVGNLLLTAPLRHRKSLYLSSSLISETLKDSAILYLLPQLFDVVLLHQQVKVVYNNFQEMINLEI